MKHVPAPSPAPTPAPSGHGFSHAENNAARSASWEGGRGNPIRVSPHGSPACPERSRRELVEGSEAEGSAGRDLLFQSPLEGTWIEIFKSGDYPAERGGPWTPEQLDLLAASYNPRLHPAPVVLGHPSHDAPAYGWVRRLRRAGHSLWAQLEKVDPAFEALLRAGRFRQRSVSLYKNFPLTRGPYLRHLGFLGAAPPAVKGLAPVRFADVPSVSFAMNEQSRPIPSVSSSPEAPMAETKSKLESFLDHLRAFFASSESRLGEGFSPSPPGSADDPAPADSSPAPSAAEGSALVANPSAFSERLAALEQRLDALTAPPRAATPLAPAQSEGSAAEGSPDTRGHIANFIESLRARGRFPPAFDRWGVSEFMERLAASDATQPANPTGKEQPVILSLSRAKPRDEAKDLSETTPVTTPTLLAYFQDFLTKLPAVIEFRELTSQGPHRSPVVRFTEPHRGLPIDPASVEMAERAEALAADLNISYAEALSRLREEHRSTTTTA